jgi:hypothetical protein
MPASHRGPGPRQWGMHALIRAGILVLGVLAVLGGAFAMASPEGFSDVVAFPPHTHFVHDLGAFQLGIGATLLLALIWTDAAAVALAGTVVGGAAHTAAHVADADLGGSGVRTVTIAVSALVAAAAFVGRWRELGWALGEQPAALPPAVAVLARHKAGRRPAAGRIMGSD